MYNTAALQIRGIQNKPFARLLLLPIGEQLRSVVFGIIKCFVVRFAPGFALDNEKHVSACVGHANIGASTLGVVPEMPFFFQLYMLRTLLF